jgi:hypothetical protein
MAECLGCDLIEIPADFVKNKTEVRLTGLDIGSFLNREAMSVLYRTDPVPPSCEVVFHTEPELNLPDQLRWYDAAWVKTFVSMQATLADYLGITPTAIEIHPGCKPNTISDVVVGARAILDEFASRFGKVPLVLLENRTGQIVSDGRHLLNFGELRRTTERSLPATSA